MAQVGASKSAFDVLMMAASRKGTGLCSSDTNGKTGKIRKAAFDDDRVKKMTKLRKSDYEYDQVIEKLKKSVYLLKKSPSEFDPMAMADCWGNDHEKVLPFVFFGMSCDLISQEGGKRTSIREIACNMLRTAMCCSPQDVLAMLCLFTYTLAPAHEVGASNQLGIGEHYTVQAVSEAYGMSKAKVKSKLKDLGDLGLVAESGRLTQPLMVKPQPLTVNEVYDTFRDIAEESGKYSREKKINIVKKLLVAAHDCEPKYLIRLLLPKRGLRIGCGVSTFLEALGQASVFHEKQNPPTLEEAAEIVRQAYSVFPVFDKIVNILLNGGLRKLQETCRLSPDIPIDPALAKPVRSVAEVVKKFRNIEYTCEYKYDGERGQIHYMDDGRVEIYSRKFERSTEKFPDITQAVSRLKKPHLRSFILDSEIVAYDRGRQTVLPLQKLSTRGRKNVKIDDIKVDACIFAFDMLYLNGESLLQAPLAVRREHLYASFVEEPGVLQFATSITSSDPAVVQNFFQNAVHASFEGLVVKSLAGQYVPKKRRWLKLKIDSVESLWDSLDLVPIGAYYGHGKRAGVYGAYLLACYDCSSGEFQTICKAGTGISDELLEDLFTSLSEKVISKPLPLYRYDAQQTTPDVWFEPSEVWEVKAGGLTVSPVYCAAYGIVRPNKGVSLRNPCFYRIRLDKGPKQATSSDQVAEMYCEQEGENHSNIHGDEDAEDEDWDEKLI